MIRQIQPCFIKNILEIVACGSRVKFDDRTREHSHTGNEPPRGRLSAEEEIFGGSRQRVPLAQGARRSAIFRGFRFFTESQISRSGHDAERTASRCCILVCVHFLAALAWSKGVRARIRFSLSLSFSR